MKQRDLIKRLAGMAKDADGAWKFGAEGGNHEVWLLNGRKIIIPRHREINELTAKGIIRRAHDMLDGRDPGQ